ncbi:MULTISPECIES: GlxA family transcriptional regulator [Pseudomonas putida group]|uniref:AraC family transcriptional regulator n=2 Tax=Pseudomonas putida group TaxID=136845 RepID=A0A2R7UE15_PSEDL|nr:MULTISPECIES: helix-turn-helix domain-containing protein [Pseudomonas putida group]MRF43190.1 helix-turn-helix domain-containing protein [Escherichia coli]MBF8704420.1 helix-turn-helix domain-containing protein [Pseudomonas putida]MBF8710352.1 helix-turn-helix domain-containing protein [Pseudomonas putida]MBF8738680.1 helix-turn-helix domain-containing protein [Pseudomonas putida]MDZ5112078.1 helix-turn-helix domain-containing protein [Pseudomonas putida]
MQAKTDNPASLDIGLLLYPGAQRAAVHGLADLFLVANRVASELGAVKLPSVRISYWQADEAGQLQPAPESVPAVESNLRVLIIPPSLESAPQGELLERHRASLCQLHRHGTVLASVCIGVFFIAASGLLDGRPACTHWNYVHSLAQRFPKVRVEAQQPLLDDGDIVTSAGLMAWTDLGLRLLERFMGATVARETARYLAVDPVTAPLPGAVFNPRLDHGDDAVLKVQHWLQGNGGQDADLAGMAACAGLEERTFLRRFRAATGLRPTEYCQQVRVGRACRLLEFTRRNVEQIAWGVGYQDPSAFRKVFQRITGLTPSDYRRRFAVSG